MSNINKQTVFVDGEGSESDDETISTQTSTVNDEVVTPLPDTSTTNDTNHDTHDETSIQDMSIMETEPTTSETAGTTRKSSSVPSISVTETSMTEEKPTLNMSEMGNTEYFLAQIQPTLKILQQRLLDLQQHHKILNYCLEEETTAFMGHSSNKSKPPEFTKNLFAALGATRNISSTNKSPSTSKSKTTQQMSQKNATSIDDAVQDSHESISNGTDQSETSDIQLTEAQNNNMESSMGESSQQNQPSKETKKDKQRKEPNEEQEANKNKTDSSTQQTVTNESDSTTQQTVTNETVTNETDSTAQQTVTNDSTYKREFSNKPITTQLEEIHMVFAEIPQYMQKLQAIRRKAADANTTLSKVFTNTEKLYQQVYARVEAEKERQAHEDQLDERLAASVLTQADLHSSTTNSSQKK